MSGLDMESGLGCSVMSVASTRPLRRGSVGEQRSAYGRRLPVPLAKAWRPAHSMHVR